MNNHGLEKALDEMRDSIRREVAGGFRSEEEIRTGVVDMLDDEYDVESLRPHAERLTREAMEAHFRDQLTWPAETDCDRLDAAFVDLESAGIVARQDFSCCSTCGSAEILDEMEAVKRRGRPVRGYTFYHAQNTEAAVDGQGIFLGYGAVKEGEAAALEIAQEIVAAIERHGLSVDWDGSWKHKIGVALDWKRKRKRS